VFGGAIQQRINITVCLASLLLFALIYRFPAMKGEVRLSLEIIFEIAISLSLAVVLWQRANKWVACFFILATVSMFWPQFGRASRSAHRLLMLGVLWYLIVVVSVDKAGCVHLLNAICAAMLLNLGVQVAQYAGGAGIFRCPQPIGLYANPNETAAFYVMALPAFLRPGWCPGWKKVLFFPLVGIYFCNAVMSYVCLSVLLIVWLVYIADTDPGWKSPLAFLCAEFLIIGMLAYLLFVPIETLLLRVKVWVLASGYIEQHWFRGAGLGHWKILFLKPVPFDGARWVTAHNDYLQIWLEMGIMSLVLIVGYFIDVVRRTRGFPIYLMALIIIAVNSSGNFLWRIAPTAMVATTWLAITEIELRGNHERII